MRSFKRVTIGWDDSTAPADIEWMTRKQVKALRPVGCWTIGFLIADELDYVTVASSRLTNGHYCGVMCIPRCSIRVLIIDDRVVLPSR